MMMRLPRVVPWESEQEWDSVYAMLYSEDHSQQQKGVNRVILATLQLTTR